MTTKKAHAYLQSLLCCCYKVHSLHNRKHQQEQPQFSRYILYNRTIFFYYYRSVTNQKLDRVETLNKSMNQSEGDDMVVTENHDEILLFEQHEHAKACGEFAKAWRDDYFIGDKKREKVIYAIYEHDNGWIQLDDQPILNKQTQIPYSFSNYPLKSKLKAYTNGINRIEKEDDYAALICSLHYASFFEGYTNGRGEGFLRQERRRQQNLIEKLNINTEDEEFRFHYNLLQFCDNLSLYLCMNRPGVDKKNEMIWFRNGFSQKFHFNNERTIIAHWLDEETITLTDFPFKQEVSVSIHYKSIKKRCLSNLQEEYERQQLQQRTVTIIKG